MFLGAMPKRQCILRGEQEARPRCMESPKGKTISHIFKIPLTPETVSCGCGPCVSLASKFLRNSKFSPNSFVFGRSGTRPLRFSCGAARYDTVLRGAGAKVECSVQLKRHACSFLLLTRPSHFLCPLQPQYCGYKATMHS